MKNAPGLVLCLIAVALAAQTRAEVTLAIKGETVHTMSGPPIQNGVILVENGKIVGIGENLPIPPGVQTLQAKVVTPGLIDAHTIVGLQGYQNEPRENDVLEKSAPIQPELRAYDAFNGRERLLEWIRGFGVTTIHTGPAPGILMPGQTMIIKTAGPTADDGLLRREAMVCVTLGEGGVNRGDADKPKSPGTRSKQIAMLRAEFIKAAEYDRKRTAKPPADADPSDEKSDKPRDRDLRLEALVRVLKKEQPLLVTAHRAQDILSALKRAREFDVNIVLDGAAEAHLMAEQIKAAAVPVIIHPALQRAGGELENMSFETAARLHAAGIPIAMQSGYESYVPKTRVVLLEAAINVANGLKPADALAAMTIESAKILGIADRVGSIEAGKDADLALYDGDPFEYTTHCVGTVIDGRLVSSEAR